MFQYKIIHSILSTNIFLVFKMMIRHTVHSALLKSIYYLEPVFTIRLCKPHRTVQNGMCR